MRNGRVNESHKLPLSLDAVVSQNFLGLVNEAESKWGGNLILFHAGFLDLELPECWKEMSVSFVQELHIFSSEVIFPGKSEDFVLELSSWHE